MHSQLERYVDALDGKLSALSPEQRSAEIAEVRAHLSDLADGHRELGLSEDEAAAAAIRQFGSPRTLAAGVQRAALARLLDTPLGAAGAILALSAVVGVLLSALLSIGFCLSLPFLSDRFHSALAFLPWFSAIPTVARPLIVGALVARWLPRHATRGALLTGIFQLGSMWGPWFFVSSASPWSYPAQGAANVVFLLLGTLITRGVRLRRQRV